MCNDTLAGARDAAIEAARFMYLDKACVHKPEFDTVPYKKPRKVAAFKI